MPSLRRSIADPLDPRHWPAHTSASIDDLTIAGVSLRCLVDWCGTPCVHSTDPGSVIVTRVEAVEARADGGIDVWVDAELEHCAVRAADSRMIGRASTAHAVAAALRPAMVPAASASLPSDLRPGDLIAVPCATVPTLHELQRSAVHPERWEG